MGPSVKFVSPNKGLISKKKNWGHFFSLQKKRLFPGGGGPRGVWQKTILFHNFFSGRFLKVNSNIWAYEKTKM